MTASTDFALQTDALASYVGPALIQKSQFIGTIITEAFKKNGAGVRSLRFRKGGFLTAATVAEAANYTFVSRVQTSITLTAEKKVSGDKLTVEALDFANEYGNEQKSIELMGGGFGRLHDADLKALFSSISGIATAATTATADLILDGVYIVESQMLDNTSGEYIAAISPKAALEIGRDLMDSSATFIANPTMAANFGLGYMLKVGERGYKGKLYGADIFQTTGLPTSGGDTVGCLWDRQHCFGGGYDVIPGAEGGVIKGEVSITNPQAGNGIAKEVLAWTYWKLGEINDEAGCRLASDT